MGTTLRGGGTAVRLWGFIGLFALLAVVDAACAPEPTATATPSERICDQYRDCLGQGDRSLRQGDWVEAIAEYTQARRLSPDDDPEALVGRGIANTWAGNFAQAGDDFNAAMRMGNGPRLMTADAYAAWGISIVAQSSGATILEAAGYIFTSALSEDSNNPDAFTGRALVHLKRAYAEGIEFESTGFGHLRKALADLEEAIRLDLEGMNGRIRRFNFEDDMAFLPNYIRAYATSGAAHISEYRDYADALQSYARVVDVAPSNVEALAGQANAYTGLGQYEDAISSFNRAIELAPDNADAFAGRGIAYTKQDEYDSAIRDLEKAIELDGGYGLGEYDDAYAAPVAYRHENVIGFALSYVGAYTSRGEAFLSVGEFNLAISDFTSAIELQTAGNDLPNISEAAALACRGIAYVEIGQYQQGIDDFDAAEGRLEDIGDKNRNCLGSMYLVARGTAHLRIGDVRGAYDDFYDVGWSSYMDSEAYVARGIAYLERSGFLIGFFGASYVEARRSFEKAIELDSQNAEAHVWHGIINELRDENSQAVADFRRAIEIAPDEFETHVENYRAWVSSLPRAHPFNVAVAIDATDANAYLGRALVYVHTGIITDGSGFLDYQARLALVLADFSKALELNPNYTQAYRARAEVYTERSYYEEAIADLERVIQLDPTD